MSNKIEFITKQNSKETQRGIFPSISISTSGSKYHKQVRISFKNGAGTKITKTGYIVFSNIDENSQKMYFKESVEGEGHYFSKNRTTDNGSITLNLHWLAEILEEYGWIGDYTNLYYEDGYYCIHKEDREISTSRKKI